MKHFAIFLHDVLNKFKRGATEEQISYIKEAFLLWFVFPGVLDSCLNFEVIPIKYDYMATPLFC